MRLALQDPRAADDEQLLELLGAHYRQLAHQQAQFWAVVAELAVRDPSPRLPGTLPWSTDEVIESAVDELRAELLVTRRSARREVDAALAVASLPEVAAALAAGVIDRARALVLAEGCADLTGKQQQALLAEVLPTAAQVTATRLAEKVARVAVALDPAWAERRYRHAVRERRLVGYLNPDGSAVVAGQNLPAEEAALACARVDALADAAKRAGAAAKIDHLRAELFLALLDGRYHAMSDAAIITDLLRLYPRPVNAAEPDPSAAPADGGSGSGGPGIGQASAGVGVHLRVGLGTLLGCDDEPGELAGWGMVPAAVARRIAARQQRSQWRFAIVDAAGRLLFDGITRHRPSGRAGGQPARGCVVELHVPARLLADAELADRHPEWAALLADLTAQYAKRRPIAQDPRARFPGRRLRRRVQTRLPRCLFPGCRRPAADCQLDHRHEHGRGGATDEHNMGPACAHDHQLKTSRGWRLVRRDETTYVWISPLGRKHVVGVEPIAPPLPEPLPRQLPGEPDLLDREEPISAPTFQHVDARGRRVSSVKRPVGLPGTAALRSDPDPPPF
jgi:hypothetical protein